MTEESTAGSDVLSWSSTSPSDLVRIRRRVRGHKARTTVFHGGGTSFADDKIRPGKEYLYTVRSIDEAGNPSKAVTVAAPPKVLTLQKTPYVVHAAPSPILRWGPVRGADYYNLQLFRGARRIYSVWPTMHQVGLPPPGDGPTVPITGTGAISLVRLGGLGPRKLARYRAVGDAAWCRAPRRRPVPGTRRPRDACRGLLLRVQLGSCVDRPV